MWFLPFAVLIARFPQVQTYNTRSDVLTWQGDSNVFISQVAPACTRMDGEPHVLWNRLIQESAMDLVRADLSCAGACTCYSTINDLITGILFAMSIIGMCATILGSAIIPNECFGCFPRLRPFFFGYLLALGIFATCLSGEIPLESCFNQRVLKGTPTMRSVVVSKSEVLRKEGELFMEWTQSNSSTALDLSSLHSCAIPATKDFVILPLKFHPTLQNRLAYIQWQYPLLPPFENDQHWWFGNIIVILSGISLLIVIPRICAPHPYIRPEAEQWFIVQQQQVLARAQAERHRRDQAINQGIA
jgi:hypothetical protein